MLGGGSLCDTPAGQAWTSAGSTHARSGSPSCSGSCHMRSSVEKRSVIVGKHKTSISLEDEFWTAVKEIAASRQTTCSGLLREINESRQAPNLSSAVRLFVLQVYQERARHSGDHASSAS